MTDALRPPEKHAHLRWHWVVIAPFMPIPAYWREDHETWSTVDGVRSAERMARDGVKYHAPAMPPPCDPAANAPDPENVEQQKLVRWIIAPDYDHPMTTLRYQIKADDLTRRVLTALRDMEKPR